MELVEAEVSVLVVGIMARLVSLNESGFNNIQRKVFFFCLSSSIMSDDDENLEAIELPSTLACVYIMLRSSEEHNTTSKLKLDTFVQGHILFEVVPYPPDELRCP